MIFYYYHVNKVPGNASHVDVNELNALLNKAQLLTRRYKDLTGQEFSQSKSHSNSELAVSSLPNPLVSETHEGLGKVPAKLPPQASGPRIINDSSTELILGMALNTDPKNLVRPFALTALTLLSFSVVNLLLINVMALPVLSYYYDVLWTCGLTQAVFCRSLRR